SDFIGSIVGPIVGLLFSDWMLENIIGADFILLMFFTPLLILVIIFARHRLHAAVALSLMTLFWMIITYNSYRYGFIGSPEARIAAFAMFMIFPLILLSVAPAKAVSRRLIFLALGLLLLIGLNELSKLGLDVTAPKFQG